MEYSAAAVWRDENLMPRAEESSNLISSTEKSDLQLVELVLTGDEAAFEQIFSRYKKLVATIASRYFQNSEQIEEIIQIIFVKVFFELKNFRGEYDFSMARWIGRITTNACLDTIRSQKRKAENQVAALSDEEVEILLSGATDKFKNAEHLVVERDLAEKLLSYLPKDDRAVLQMFYAEEMTVGEIAAVTGWSNSKIKVRAFRAKNALRKILKKLL